MQDDPFLPQANGIIGLPVSDYYSMITTCIPQNGEVTKNLDVIKRQILGNPEMELSIVVIVVLS